MPESVICVAIIGAGPLGRRLAMAAVRAGFRVMLEDVMPSNLRHAQESLREALGPESMPLVGFALTVEEAVREADLAIDCVPDELESKLEILSLLDRMAPPRTVFVTPTLNLSIADLASCTYRGDRCFAIAIDAAEMAREEASLPAISLLITSLSDPDAVALVERFWLKLGYSTVRHMDAAEVHTTRN